MKVHISNQVSARFSNMGLICACMVVLIHCPRPIESSGFDGWWAMAIQNGVCRVAVPFFFLASGYFLAGHMNEPGWWRREALKRVKTLFLPFLFWNMIYALCSLAFRFIDGSQPTTWETWAKFLVASIEIVPFGGFHMGALWFVRALLVLVLISPILKRLSTHRGLLALFILNIALDPYPFEGRFGWFRYFVMPMVSFCGMAWFTLGIYFRRENIIERFSEGFGSRGNLALLLLGVVGFIFRAFAVKFGWNWLWTCYIGWASVPLVMGGGWMVLPTTKWPLMLISCAFPLYLVHEFAIMFLRRFTWFVSLPDIFSLSVCVIVVSFVLVFVIRHTGERVCAFVFGGR